jgi:hypothetical protein
MKYLFPLLIFFNYSISKAQNIGIGTRAPLSKLHVAGDLRVDSLSNKDSGLVIHNDKGVLRSVKFTGKREHVLFGDGTFQSLDAVLATSATWLTTGNSGVDELANFLGTTDAKALLFRVNNITAGIIHPVSGNIAFGKRSLAVNKPGPGTGYSNISIGTDALKKNISGHNLIAIGDSAMFNQPGNTGGTFEEVFGNMAIGSKALFSNIQGGGNLAVGTNTLRKNLRASNTAIGQYSLENNTTGSSNTAVGTTALRFDKDGHANTAVGFHSLIVGGGGENTAVGMQSMGNSSGQGNVSVGAWSMAGQPLELGGVTGIGNHNTALGHSSLQNVHLGNNNVAIGSNAMGNTVSGSNNTAVGFAALVGNINGKGLVAVGDSSLFNQANNASGIYGNTAIGSASLLKNTTGFRNTAIGFRSLYTITTGGGNTAIGNGADVTSATMSNSIAIGFNTKVNASNKVRLGNAAITKIEGQVPFSIPSDGRFKFNIRDDVKGLDFIMRLRAVSYQFDVNRWDGIEDETLSNEMKVSYIKASEMRRTGFIAQEVDRAAELTGFQFSGISRPETSEGRYSLSYESFVVPLVKGMQEQQKIILDLQARVKQQDLVISELLRRMEKLEDK